MVLVHFSLSACTAGLQIALRPLNPALPLCYANNDRACGDYRTHERRKSFYTTSMTVHEGFREAESVVFHNGPRQWTLMVASKPVA